MQRPIIEIREISPEWKQGLIDLGILEMRDGEIHVKENVPTAPTKA